MTRPSLLPRIAPLMLALVVAVACTKAPNDAQVTSDIQSKLAADSGLQNKQLTVQSDKGAVTLSGTVDNDAQREAAAKYAASEAGVKQVINNLQVAPMVAASTAPEEAPPASSPAGAASAKAAASTKHHQKSYQSADDSRAAAAPP